MIVWRCVNPQCVRYGQRTERVCEAYVTAGPLPIRCGQAAEQGRS